MQRFEKNKTYTFGRVSGSTIQVKNPRFSNTVRRYSKSGAELQRLGVTTIQQFAEKNPFGYTPGTLIHIYVIEKSGEYPELSYIGETTINEAPRPQSAEGLADEHQPVRFFSTEQHGSLSVNKVADVFREQHANLLTTLNEQVRHLTEGHTSQVATLNSLVQTTLDAIRNNYERQIATLEETIAEWRQRYDMVVAENKMLEQRIADANTTARLQIEIAKTAKEAEAFYTSEYKKFQQQQKRESGMDDDWISTLLKSVIPMFMGGVPQPQQPPTALPPSRPLADPAPMPPAPVIMPQYRRDIRLEHEQQSYDTTGPELVRFFEEPTLAVEKNDKINDTVQKSGAAYNADQLLNDLTNYNSAS